MAPLATRRKTSSSSSTSIKPRASTINSRIRKPRRTTPSSHFHNQNPQISRINADVEESASASPSPSSSEAVAAAADELASPAAASCCSTPKGHKFRIPEASTCPPAPKKKKPRSLLSSNSPFSLRRSPISFFAPPDLELFFFLSLPAST